MTKTVTANQLGPKLDTTFQYQTPTQTRPANDTSVLISPRIARRLGGMSEVRRIVLTLYTQTFPSVTSINDVLEDAQEQMEILLLGASRPGDPMSAVKWSPTKRDLSEVADFCEDLLRETDPDRLAKVGRKPKVIREDDEDEDEDEDEDDEDGEDEE